MLILSDLCRLGSELNIGWGRAMPDGARKSSVETVREADSVVSRLGEIYRVDRAPSLVTTSFRASNLVLTEIKSSDPLVGVTAPVPVEDAFLLSVPMKDLINFQAWEDGCAMPRRTFRVGESMLRDLKKSPAALIDQPLHHLVFYLPRSAIDQLVADVGAMPDRATDIARSLAEQAEAVSRHYLSSGRREGRYWLVGDVDNTPGRSLFVRLKPGVARIAVHRLVLPDRHDLHWRHSGVCGGMTWSPGATLVTPAPT